jgi:hypothetical protein
MMLDTKLPCFRGKTIQQLRARLVPEATDQEAAKFMMAIVNNCYTNLRSNVDSGCATIVLYATCYIQAKCTTNCNTSKTTFPIDDLSA